VEHDGRVRPDDPGRHDPSARLDLEVLRSLRIRYEDAACPIVDAARIACRNPSVGLEGRRQRGELLQRRVPPWMLVRVEQPFLAVLVEHRDRLDLPFESTFVDRPDRLW